MSDNQNGKSASDGRVISWISYSLFFIITVFAFYHAEGILADSAGDLTMKGIHQRRNAVFLVIGAIWIGFTMLFLSDLARGYRVEITRHWGGFTTGTSGWRFSRTMLFMFGSFLFGAALVAMLVQILPSDEEHQKALKIERQEELKAGEIEKNKPDTPSGGETPKSNDVTPSKNIGSKSETGTSKTGGKTQTENPPASNTDGKR